MNKIENHRKEGIYIEVIVCLLEVVEPINVEQLVAGVPEEVHPVGIRLVQLLTVLPVPVHRVPEPHSNKNHRGQGKCRLK